MAATSLDNPAAHFGVPESLLHFLLRVSRSRHAVGSTAQF
jgi:hypothetical protein